MDYEEKTVECIECQKVMKIVTVSGQDDEDFLCPQCEAGEIDIGSFD